MFSSFYSLLAVLISFPSFPWRLVCLYNYIFCQQSMNGSDMCLFQAWSWQQWACLFHVLFLLLISWKLEVGCDGNPAFTTHVTTMLYIVAVSLLICVLGSNKTAHFSSLLSLIFRADRIKVGGVFQSKKCRLSNFKDKILQMPNMSSPFHGLRAEFNISVNRTRLCVQETGNWFLRTSSPHRGGHWFMK